MYATKPLPFLSLRQITSEIKKSCSRKEISKVCYQAFLVTTLRLLQIYQCSYIVSQSELNADSISVSGSMGGATSTW